MDEYISRKQVMDKMQEVSHWCGYEDRYDEVVFREDIEDIPAADVEPVRYGTWISFLDGDSIMPERYYRCSRCGRVEGREEPYCHCGARMRRQ